MHLSYYADYALIHIIMWNAKKIATQLACIYIPRQKFFFTRVQFPQNLNTSQCTYLTMQIMPLRGHTAAYETLTASFDSLIILLCDTKYISLLSLKINAQ